MRSLPQAQHGHVQQALKTLLITLALMLVLVGSTLSLSAFTQAPSIGSQPINAGTVHHYKPSLAGCFPGNAVWTWVGSSGIYQAWITPGETYPTKHFNFHVQWYCGSDIANYHVMYIGHELFQTYESVHGVTKNWGNSSFDLCNSMTLAAGEIAANAANQITQPDSNQLQGASYKPLWNSMNALIGGWC